MRHTKISLLLAFAILVYGCAPMKQPPLQNLEAGSAVSAGNKYQPKIDNFQVILDASRSMDDGGKNYFLEARDIVKHINQKIPADLDYKGGLRSVGHNGYQSGNLSDLLYGMSGYDRNDFHAALSKVLYTGGDTPMATGLAAAGSDLKALAGKSALIIISDGLDMADAPDAAKSVKDMMGSNLCIYTIAVGNERNGSGHEMLQQIADIGQCGFATTAAELADDAKLNAFVENVFLAPKKAAPKVMSPKDSDGDGVTDDKDKCPATPRGEMVDVNGCTLKLTLHINFDFDKYDIKPVFKPELDKAAAYIKHYSQVPYIMLAGHTDHDGSVEYNQTLSENRANAVRDYLIQNYGIKAERLIAKGFGKMQPVSDNSTQEGRYQNRRVEVVCCVIKPE